MMRPCKRCKKKLSDWEICWWCSGELCGDCWDEVGHCGHSKAELRNKVNQMVEKAHDYLLPHLEVKRRVETGAWSIILNLARNVMRATEDACDEEAKKEEASGN